MNQRQSIDFLKVLKLMTPLLVQMNLFNKIKHKFIKKLLTDKTILFEILNLDLII